MFFEFKLKKYLLKLLANEFILLHKSINESSNICQKIFFNDKNDKKKEKQKFALTIF
jgi:hypothetical protein